ncbi:MAG: Gfo/Idh/MocA family protein [Promethearchaeota archaeon]
MVKTRENVVTAVLIGAGTRGRDAYGKYALAHPNRLKFIAVADIDPDKRRIFQGLHGIPNDMAFSSWETLLNDDIGKIADVAFICTPDKMHYEPAMRAIDLGYDLVLEKPIAQTLEQCKDIAASATKHARVVQVCHVLRYTSFWRTVREIVSSGVLGKIIHYDHSENVSFWHFGHSFVRGAYKNKNTSTPIVLAKTCHDLDLLYWIIGEKAEKVQSTGELTWYRPENAPPGAPDRCTDGCPFSEQCPWYAPRLYIEAEPLIRIGKESNSWLIKKLTNVALHHKNIIKFFSLFDKRLKTILNWDQFPVTSLTTDFTPEGKMKALKEGDYGKCIFKCGNDVPDHQVSTFNFPSGATGTLTMHGLSEFEGRELRIFGSKGVLRGFFRYLTEWIEITDFRTGKTKLVFKGKTNIEDGHGGGDAALMDAFTSAMLEKAGPLDKKQILDINEAMESHFMGFAAEESRTSRKILNLSDFR